VLTAIVLDIEGTTSSTGFVHDTLYPYSRERFQTWITAHLADPQWHGEVARQLAAVRQVAGEPEADLARCVWWLHHWLDGDQKITPLKAIQGWIWQQGFACGDLTSHFFDDAIPALRRWHSAGHRLHIFSSGSLAAQYAWFGHTPDGDLLPLFSGHWDTETAGPKKQAGSYRLISTQIDTASGCDAAHTVFLSDLVDELDAARSAGWHTVGVRRQGDQYFDRGVGDHLAITSFDQVDLSGDRPVFVGDRRP
jgi:enolase-phosphatase E1